MIVAPAKAFRLRKVQETQLTLWKVYEIYLPNQGRAARLPARVADGTAVGAQHRFWVRKDRAQAVAGQAREIRADCGRRRSSLGDVHGHEGHCIVSEDVDDLDRHGVAAWLGVGVRDGL